MEKKTDENYTRMLRAILNKSWKTLPTKQHLYGHLTPISQTIQDIQGTAGEARMNSCTTFFYKPFHMDALVLADY